SDRAGGRSYGSSGACHGTQGFFYAPREGDPAGPSARRAASFPEAPVAPEASPGTGWRHVPPGATTASGTRRVFAPAAFPRTAHGLALPGPVLLLERLPRLREV